MPTVRIIPMKPKDNEQVILTKSDYIFKYGM